MHSQHDIVTTLDNGVRIVVFPMPHLSTASVSVFVRSGSHHETKRLNGISHLIEHMAFKGTHARDCQQINLDAERLGADVNAHTDKDHTAFHMRGHARDAARFIDMLGDIVQRSTFPADELERERQVLLHEFVEDEDDGLATAFKMFDVACYGEHTAAQPVIGTRANLRRFTRDDIVSFVASRYTGVNTIVGVAGGIDAESTIDAVRTAFGAMPRGEANALEPPRYVGGIRLERDDAGDQVHIVLGFPSPALGHGHDAFRVAAALFGEGMSSPLLDRVRERRGLVYHADCYNDARDMYGQFVIEASTSPKNLDAFTHEVSALLRQHCETIIDVDLERARNQLTVRALFDEQGCENRLEHAAMDLFVLGRIRPLDERLAAIDAVDVDRVREVFRTMLHSRAAIGIAGKFGTRVEQRLARIGLPVN